MPARKNRFRCWNSWQMHQTSQKPLGPYSWGLFGGALVCVDFFGWLRCWKWSTICRHNKCGEMTKYSWQKRDIKARLDIDVYKNLKLRRIRILSIRESESWQVLTVKGPTFKVFGLITKNWPGFSDPFTWAESYRGSRFLFLRIRYSSIIRCGCLSVECRGRKKENNAFATYGAKLREWMLRRSRGRSVALSVGCYLTYLAASTAASRRKEFFKGRFFCWPTPDGW